MEDIDLAMDVVLSEDEEEENLLRTEDVSSERNEIADEGEGICELQKPSANEFSDLRLMEELDQRKLRVTGLRDEDVVSLQEALDNEYEQERKLMSERRRIAELARMQRRHEFLEKQAAKEKAGLLENSEVMSCFGLIRQNATEKMARIRITNITSRPLARALCSNISLVDLDVSRNCLDDMAGAYFAKCLRHNTTLRKLSMGHNNFAAKTCKSLSMSLLENKTLIYLGLDCNPLFSSSAEWLGDLLQAKCSLLSLSLWRCGLGIQGGRSLLEGLDHNTNLISMEVGYNGLSKYQERTIAMKLRENSNEHYRAEAVVRAKQLKSNGIMRDEKSRAIALRKEIEAANWLQKQKAKREKNRRCTAEMRCSSEEAARDSWLSDVYTRQVLQDKKPK